MYIFDISELIDYICNFLTIRCMYTLMRTNNYLKDIVCSNNNFKTIKKYNTSSVYSCLNIACNRNDEKIIIYLLENYKFSNNFIAKLFVDNCSDDHLNVIKILYNPNINIHDNKEYVFRWSCWNGHLNTAKWLYQLDNKIDIHILKDYTFRVCCAIGQLDVAKWLYSLDGKIDIHAANNSAFRWSCINCHLDVVQWLCEICPDYTIVENDKAINGFYLNSKLC